MMSQTILTNTLRTNNDTCFTQDQVRAIAMIIVDLESCKKSNTIHEFQISNLKEQVKEYVISLNLKDDQLNYAKKEARKQRHWKNFYIFTTGISLGLTVIFAL